MTELRAEREEEPYRKPMEGHMEPQQSTGLGSLSRNTRASSANRMKVPADWPGQAQEDRRGVAECEPPGEGSEMGGGRDRLVSAGCLL